MRMEGRRMMVTGAAGFIGSHLTDRLLRNGNQVLGVDDLSGGREAFLEDARSTGRFELVTVDLLNDDIVPMLKEVDVVFHLAANPDVRLGAKDTRVHFDQNIGVTYRLLEACREAGTKELVFASTSTVYGETEVIPTPEDFGPLRPISLYGASKLACEALISSYCHSFDMSSVIYRFANVVGPRSTHNVIHDFVRKLRADPTKLEILGAEPGTCKSYVHVSDCVEGMVHGAERAGEQVEIYNIGSMDWTNVLDIADIVSGEMGLQPRYDWTGGVMGGRGWVGDVKRMLLSTERIRSRGWEARLSSSQAIREAVRAILSEAEE
jgi:UDP-glucose 4-epimerase